MNKQESAKPFTLYWHRSVSEVMRKSICKYIVNAVEVKMTRVLCEALCKTLLTMQRKVS